MLQKSKREIKGAGNKRLGVGVGGGGGRGSVDIGQNHTGKWNAHEKKVLRVKKDTSSLCLFSEFKILLRNIISTLEHLS